MTITKYTSDKDNSYTQMMHLYFGATLISILFFIFTQVMVNLTILMIQLFNLFLENGLQIQLMHGQLLF